MSSIVAVGSLHSCGEEPITHYAWSQLPMLAVPTPSLQVFLATISKILIWSHIHTHVLLPCCTLCCRIISCVLLTNLELTAAGVSMLPMAAGALALIRISIPPNVSTALSTAACTWSSSRISTTHGRHRPPAASTITQKRRKYILHHSNYSTACAYPTFFGCCMDCFATFARITG